MGRPKVHIDFIVYWHCGLVLIIIISSSRKKKKKLIKANSLKFPTNPLERLKFQKKPKGYNIPLAQLMVQHVRSMGGWF